MSEAVMQKFRKFIEDYCYEELLNNVKTGKQYLLIDFSKLTKFDYKLAEQLLLEPKETITAAEDAIREFDIPGAKYPMRARIINLPKSQSVHIRHIRSRHLGLLVGTGGLIRQASDIRPKVILATFECPSCNAQILVEQVDSKFREPERCQCGRKGRFKLSEKKMVDVQRLEIEESPDSLDGGEQPKRISVYVSEDLLEPQLEKRRYPGNKISVVGIIKEVPVLLRTGGQSTKYDLLVDANSIETIEEEFGEIEISTEEAAEIEKLANDPRVYEKLASSIAPSIQGYDNVKGAIVLQLFGGIKKVRPDGTMSRGDIHLFLIGDPGAGKSEILRYVATLAPKARYVSGKSATGAGITASVVRDEFMHGWALEAGALVLANNGLCSIDELDKMDKDDRSAMHEIMEQQTCTIAKANIHATLRAETTILAAANPKFGRFDPYSPIPSQIDLPSTLINRFDLIFPIRDIPDPIKDETIASHVLELHKRGGAIEGEIPGKLLRKYIAYAKQNCFPKLTDTAIDEIKKFYVSLRNSAVSDDSAVKPIPISARQLQALVRLSEASARVRLSKKITKRDAQRSIDLLRSCMQAVGTDPETGKFDIDRITTGITASQRNKILVVKQIIDDLEEKMVKVIPVNDVLAEASAEGLEKDKVEEILQNLKQKGDIFEPKPGTIQKIG